jgi:hypothetical protein
VRQYFYSGIVLTETGQERSVFYGTATADGEGLMTTAEFDEIVQNITTKNAKVKSDRILLRAFNLLHQAKDQEVSK